MRACVLGKNENILATLDPNTYTAYAWFAKGLAKGKLEELLTVDNANFYYNFKPEGKHENTLVQGFI